MPVVSNTSPILNLAVIGRLELLRRQFGEVLIPEAVRDELRAEDPLPGSDAIRAALEAGWLRAGGLEGDYLRRALEADLDAGEAAAIALAVEAKAPTRFARRRTPKTPVTASPRRLAARRPSRSSSSTRSAIPSLRSDVEALLRDAGFRVREDLVRALLTEAGEAERPQPL